jgi:hypothetical protein
MSSQNGPHRGTGRAAGSTERLAPGAEGGQGGRANRGTGETEKRGDGDKETRRRGEGEHAPQHGGRRRWEHRVPQGASRAERLAPSAEGGRMAAGGHGGTGDRKTRRRGDKERGSTHPSMEGEGEGTGVGHRISVRGGVAVPLQELAEGPVAMTSIGQWVGLA